MRVSEKALVSQQTQGLFYYIRIIIKKIAQYLHVKVILCATL